MENLFNKSIKKQTMEGLFKTTFKEVINSANQMYIFVEEKCIFY